MNVLILFSYGISLKDWNNLGILNRELTIYKKLSEKNIKFNFLTYGNQIDYKYQPSFKKSEIYPIRNLINSNSAVLKLLKSFFLPFKLKKVFKNVDIIKTNQIEGCWVSFLAKIFFRKKLIIRGGYEWLRNYSEIIPKNNLIAIIKYILNFTFIFIIELLAFNLADIIILTTQSNIDYIVKTFKLKRKSSKIFLIPNFIDINQFKPKNFQKKDKTLLFVGRLSREKNLINLLKALRTLKDFTLDMVGTGSMEEILKKEANLLGVNLNFLGIISNEKLSDIYNQYDLFIMPSFYENNPKALLEAMSCGLACIGTNVRGINEIIQHKQNGYLCNTDSESITKAVSELYNDIYLRKKLNNNARGYIVKHFCLDDIIKQELIIYQKTLNDQQN